MTRRHPPFISPRPRFVGLTAGVVAAALSMGCEGDDDAPDTSDASDTSDTFIAPQPPPDVVEADDTLIAPQPPPDDVIEPDDTVILS